MEWRRSRGIISSAPSTGMSVSALTTAESSLVMILSVSVFPRPSDVPRISSRCRSCTAEKSTLLSSQQRGDLTTLSISIQSSQLRHPEVQAVTLPPPPALHAAQS